jgi:hypothetical protein
MAHVPLPASAHSLTREQTLRIAGIAGMAMLPLFATTVIVLTWLEWDFLRGTGWTVLDAHQVNYPSGLARGHLGAVQSLNFLMLGALAIIFGRACEPSSYIGGPGQSPPSRSARSACPGFSARS